LLDHHENKLISSLRLYSWKNLPKCMFSFYLGNTKSQLVFLHPYWNVILYGWSCLFITKLIL